MNVSYVVAILGSILSREGWIIECHYQEVGQMTNVIFGYYAKLAIQKKQT